MLALMVQLVSSRDSVEKLQTRLDQVFPDDGPNEISEVEITVRNNTTSTECESLPTVGEDRKFMTKVGRPFTPKRQVVGEHTNEMSHK